MEKPLLTNFDGKPREERGFQLTKGKTQANVKKTDLRQNKRIAGSGSQKDKQKGESKTWAEGTDP